MPKHSPGGKGKKRPSKPAASNPKPVEKRRASDSKKPTPARGKAATPSKTKKIPRAAAPAATRKPIPPPPVEPPPRLLQDTKSSAAALAMLERGIKLLHRKEIRKARAELQDLLKSYPDEKEILAKARSYIQICEREEAQERKQKVTADEAFSMGVVEHNRGAYDSAIGYFRQYLSLKRDDDHAHYSLAASLALKGDAPSAIQSLRRAIELSGRNRVFAKNDPDFVGLHAFPEFTSLVGTIQTSSAGTAT